MPKDEMSMTVGQLIEKLRGFDKNVEVFISVPASRLLYIADIRVERDQTSNQPKNILNISSFC